MGSRPMRRSLASSRRRKPGRDQTREKPEQEIRQDFPIRAELEMRDGIDRIAPDKTAHGERGDDRGKNERPKNLHRDRAEHNLGDEKRTCDRRVISGGNPSRRAATDQQTQPRRRPSAPAPGGRGDQGRQLHQRPLPPDRAARGDGEHGGETFHDAAPGRDFAVAEHDRFHVVGRSHAAMPAHPEVEHQPGQQSARGRDR